MLIDTLYKTIAQARQHECDTGQLTRLLVAGRQRLSPAIHLPRGNETCSLLAFTQHYIEQVPAFIAQVTAIAAAAHIESYTNAVLSVAIEFFLQPPETDADSLGLDALMDEAYVAHRLLEETNELFMARAGMPLVPMDLAAANLIMHHLIGEPFANELDDAVQFTMNHHQPAARAFQSSAFKAYVAKQRLLGRSTHWPCFTSNEPIALRFAS